ncbi:MAG: acyl-CoA dehydratase activase [Peptococcaceae bacterium]|jgi:benzoyl-CoA reductase subunit A|nr:acyl-CoA dehydratase activase [Peptococcaceae bacterium]
MARKYSVWPESSWTSRDIGWKTARSVTAGVDIGTTSSQAAILCDGQLFGYASIRSGFDYKKSADRVIKQAAGDSGLTLDDIECIVSTGFGHKNVSCAAKYVDEIHCHAKGARFMFGPEVHTVVDLGGQTVAAIRLYDWDRVRDFMMNDKCAVGMGRSLETVCELLQIPIEEIGEKSLEADMAPEPVSTTCYCFANTETMGLFGRPEFRSAPLTETDVYASHTVAFAWRRLGVIGRLQPQDVGDLKVYGELCFTGGVAKNIGVTKIIEREMGVTALTSPYDPMLAGAIGAALLA